MDLKIDFTLVKGRWYMALKTKGYKSAKVLNDLINSFLPDVTHFVVTFTDTQTNDTILRAVISDKVDTKYKSCYTMSLYRLDGSLVSSHEECLKLVKDFALPPEFYINYNDNRRERLSTNSNL